MNYHEHYKRLIDRAKGRVLGGYSERHHVKPRCIGGSNLKKNIVRLTPEEHYVAHLLLVKMYPNEPKLVFAAHMMTIDAHGRRRNNKFYGWLKRRMVKAISNTNAGKSHHGISEEHHKKLLEANLGRPLSEDHRRKLSEAHKGKKLSAATRKKMSKVHKGRKFSEETRRRMSEAWAGKPKSEEHRKKMVETLRKYWEGRRVG